MTQTIEPLDLVAIKEAAEKFLAVASSDECTAREYVESYNAYVQVVDVETVLGLVRQVEKSKRLVERAIAIDKLQRDQKRALYRRAIDAECANARVRKAHVEYVISEWNEQTNSPMVDDSGELIVAARLCQECSSEDAVESAGDAEWHEGEFYEVPYPCPTIQALDNDDGRCFDCDLPKSQHADGCETND